MSGCKACGFSGVVESITGAKRPCSRCRSKDFSDWYQVMMEIEREPIEGRRIDVAHSGRRLELPRDLLEIAKLARCKPEAIRLFQCSLTRRSWRIPIFRGKVMTYLWIAERDRFIIPGDDDTEWKGYKNGEEKTAAPVAN